MLPQKPKPRAETSKYDGVNFTKIATGERFCEQIVPCIIRIINFLIRA